MAPRLVMAYCGDGPYRHIRKLIGRDPNTWLPWGYGRRRIERDVDLQQGQEVEVWEIDNTRRPRYATPLAMATLDFVQQNHDYVAVTLRCFKGEAKAREPEVLSRVRAGLFVFASSPQVGDVSEPPVTARH